MRRTTVGSRVRGNGDIAKRSPRPGIQGDTSRLLQTWAPACAGATYCSVALSLPVLELRLAFVDERAHAFLLVVEHKRRMKLAALEEEPFRE